MSNRRGNASYSNKSDKRGIYLAVYPGSDLVYIIAVVAATATVNIIGKLAAATAQ